MIGTSTSVKYNRFSFPFRNCTWQYEVYSWQWHEISALCGNGENIKNCEVGLKLVAGDVCSCVLSCWEGTVIYWMDGWIHLTLMAAAGKHYTKMHWPAWYLRSCLVITIVSQQFHQHSAQSSVSLSMQISGVQGLAKPVPLSTSSSNPPQTSVPVGGKILDEKQKTKVAYQHLLPEFLHTANTAV